MWQYPVIRTYSNEELMHYGVPGMKWGRRMRSALRSKTAQNIGRAALTGGKVVRDYGSAVGGSMKRSLLHPNMSKKALDDSIASEKSLSTKVRRRVIASSTKEINDTNHRVDQMIAAKKALKLAKENRKKNWTDTQKTMNKMNIGTSIAAGYVGSNVTSGLAYMAVKSIGGTTTAAAGAGIAAGIIGGVTLGKKSYKYLSKKDKLD